MAFYIKLAVTGLLVMSVSAGKDTLKKSVKSTAKITKRSGFGGQSHGGYQSQGGYGGYNMMDYYGGFSGEQLHAGPQFQQPFYPQHQGYGHQVYMQPQSFGYQPHQHHGIISSGINRNHLTGLLSKLTGNAQHIPAISQHIYGPPKKIVVNDEHHHGKPVKTHGHVQTFHSVRTIDEGGQILSSSGGHHGHNQKLPQGSFSDYSGYEDFHFPADW